MIIYMGIVYSERVIMVWPLEDLFLDSVQNSEHTRRKRFKSLIAASWMNISYFLFFVYLIN